MASIHPTAIIGENAKIDPTAEVGAYAIIENGAEVGAGSIIEPHARLCSGAKIGANCTISSFTTIAGLPQDLHFDKSTISYVEIGDGSVVREGATIHRATKENASTKIGKNCLIMANAHIGHDCVFGDRVIMAPFSAAGGFVEVGNDTFISGGVMLHQKIRVGEGAMLSGNSALSLDVPPFVNSLSRNNIAGFNLVGLMRRKVAREAIAELKKLYALVYGGGNPRKNAKEAFDSDLAKTNEGKTFLRFFFENENSKGIVRPRSRNED